MASSDLFGWIKLNRKILNNSLWLSEPFTRGQAWVDMLLIANSSDGFFFKRGIRVDVKRGQIGFDIDTLAKRWKWSRGKCERFFFMLEMDSQIIRQKNNVTTLISILNYESYQTNDKAKSKADSKADGNKQESKEINKFIYSEFYDSQLENCNNEKYIHFVKYIFGENMLNKPLSGVLSIKEQLTENEFQTILNKCTANKKKIGDIVTKIENDVKYYKGKKSLYRTLLNWAEDRFVQ